MPLFTKICLTIVIAGGLSWGLIGLFSFDFVAWALGGTTAMLARVVYVIFAIGALGAIPALFVRDDAPSSTD